MNAKLLPVAHDLSCDLCKVHGLTTMPACAANAGHASLAHRKKRIAQNAQVSWQRVTQKHSLLRGSLLATAAKGVRSRSRQKWQHWVSAAEAVGLHSSRSQGCATPRCARSEHIVRSINLCEGQYTALRHCTVRARRLSAMAVRSRIACANSAGGLSSTQHPSKFGKVAV